MGAYGLVDLARLGGPIFINVSHGADMVRNSLSRFAPSATFLHETPEPVGTGATLLHLREQLSGPVVARNADSLTGVAIAGVIATHRAGGRLATIATRAVDQSADLAVADGAAVRFIDRRVESVAGDMWIGISVFERSALELLDGEGPRDLATGLLAPLIDRGEVSVHRHDGYFLDVGTIDRYLQASTDVLNGTVTRLGSGGEVVDVEGGRAFVDVGTRIESASLGPDAVVLEGAAVEPGALIERAIVWPGETVPAGTEVRDGVWAFGALQR